MEEQVTSSAPPPDEDDVMGVLRGVIDPELGTDIVELGMARSVAVAETVAEMLRGRGFDPVVAHRDVDR